MTPVYGPYIERTPAEKQFDQKIRKHELSAGSQLYSVLTAQMMLFALE